MGNRIITPGFVGRTRRRGGPGSYGPVLLLDSTAPSYQDSARTTLAVADGDVVGSITGLGSAGVNPSQTTSGKKPILKLGQTPAGKPAWRFDGVDDCLAFTQAGFALGSKTVVLVARLPGGSATSRVVLGNGSAEWYVGAGNASAGRSTISSHTTAAGAQSANYSSGPVWTDKDFLVVSYRWQVSGSTVTVVHHVNGVVVCSVTLGSGYTASVPASGWVIGGFNTGSLFANIDLADLCVVPRDLSDAELSALESHYRAKHGL